MNPLPDSSSRKTVWITGAGKGIGRAVAKRMAHDGWTVAASSRTLADLLELQTECPEGRVHVYPLDITNVENNAAVVAQIEGELDPLQLVILNAGTHQPTPVEHFSVPAFRSLVETNLMGTVNGLEPVLKRFMGRNSGHIAVVASLAGYRGLPSASAYGATKAALINMCEALKIELEPFDVRMTLINPGFVETPLTDKNDFPMPFLISVDEAAKQVCRGLESNAFEISFPWRFAWIMKVMRLLPAKFYFALSRRMM